MKKILRLVTTSVLTLTLVACGEASSSVVSSVSSTPAGSVSSPVSSFANVTTITLTAGSDSLTQVMGNQKTVLVNAAIGAGTNPATQLVWLVNGIQQAQSGTRFEFTPVEAGSFSIVARVGNTVSNTIKVDVTSPKLIVESYKFIDADTVEVKAPAGALITVVGNELKDDSYFDIDKGVYVLNLKTPFEQEQSSVLRLEKEGFETLTENIVFDETKFEIDNVKFGLIGSLTAVTADGGVYKVTKPFDEGTQFDRRYEIALKQEKIFGTTPVSLTRELTVPTGATAVPTTTNLVTSLAVIPFDVTSATVPGLYTHKVTLGKKVVEIKIEVVEPEAVIVFDQQTVGGTKFDVTSGGVGVKADAAGVFEIVKPYNSIDTVNTIVVKLSATNFEKPEFLNNQYNVTLTGPTAFSATPTTLFAGFSGKDSGIATYNSNEMGVNLSFEPFAGGPTGFATTTSANFTINQKFDQGTPVGLYTFNVVAGSTETKQVTKEVKIRIVAPEADIDFTVTDLVSFRDSDLTQRLHLVDSTVEGTYVIEKPIIAGTKYTIGWYAVLSNYQSELANVEEVATDASITVAGNKKLFNTALAATPSNTVLGSGTIDTSLFYKFVNYSLAVNGPSEDLGTSVNASQVKLRLGANTNAIVLANQLGVDWVGRNVVTTKPVTANAKYAISDGKIYFTTAQNIFNSGNTLTSTIPGTPAGGLFLQGTTLPAAAAGWDTSIFYKTDTAKVYVGASGAWGSPIDPVPYAPIKIGDMWFDEANNTLTVATQANNDFVGALTYVIPVAQPTIAIGDSWYDKNSNSLYTATVAETFVGATKTPLTAIASQTAAGNYFGLDASKPSTIGHPSVYVATDTLKVYKTSAADTWGAVTNTNLNNFWFNESIDKLYTFEYLVPTVTAASGLVLDTTKDANEADTTVFDLEGLFRNKLEITNTTVPGTYTFKITVDNISSEISFVINNPTHKVFVLTGFDGTNATTPSRENAFSTTGAKFEQLLVDVDSSLSRADFYVPLVKGAYEVELYSDLTKVLATIAVVDLPINTAGYAYDIKKVYPDGRIAQYTDVVKVDSLDENQVATFDSTNAQFINNWKIDEANLVKGVYKFTFTINGVTREYTINVVDKPSIKINKVTWGTLEAVLFNGAYRFVRPSNGNISAAKITLEVTLDKVLSSHVLVVTDGPTADTGTMTESALASNVLVGTTGKLEIATLAAASAADGATQDFKIQIFVNKGTAAAPVFDSAKQIGEDLIIKVTINE